MRDLQAAMELCANSMSDELPHHPQSVAVGVSFYGPTDDVDWLPGSLEGVVRVELDWGIPRGQFASVSDSEGAVFRTSGYPRSIPGVAPEHNLKGLSFAVANMTGLAAREMTRKSVSGYADLIAVLHQQTNQ